MKKLTFKVVIAVMAILMLPIQAVQACCGFIFGRQLTADGSTMFGRTEDYPYYPNGGKHNKNYVVVEGKNYKEGDQIVDESNGFTYPHAANEMKYTATYDSARGDGSNGAFGEHGFNEAGVSMTSTVTAIPNKKVLAKDPLKADGLPVVHGRRVHGAERCRNHLPVRELGRAAPEHLLVTLQIQLIKALAVAGNLEAEAGREILLVAEHHVHIAREGAVHFLRSCLAADCIPHRGTVV